MSSSNSNNPYYPYLQFNPLTNEPFLRLPPPHTDIIITPTRLHAFKVKVKANVAKESGVDIQTVHDGSDNGVPASVSAGSDGSSTPLATTVGDKDKGKGKDGNEEGSTIEVEIPSDIDSILPLLNDPRIYRNLIGPPFPYTREHAEDWVSRTDARSAKILNEIRERVQSGETTEGTQTPISGCPVHILRKLKLNGDGIGNGVGSDGQAVAYEDEFLGDVSLVRSMFHEVEDLEERQRLVEENDAREAGDEGIVWSFGDYLHPSYHHRSIMSLAIRALLHTFAFPHMRVQRIISTALEDNIASKRVFEKNGFKVIGFVGKEEGKGVWVGAERRTEYAEREEKGKWIGIWVLEWRRGEGNSGGLLQEIRERKN